MVVIAFPTSGEARVNPIPRDQSLTGQSEDFAAMRIHIGKTARTFRNEIDRLRAETRPPAYYTPSARLERDRLRLTRPMDNRGAVLSVNRPLK